MKSVQFFLSQDLAQAQSKLLGLARPSEDLGTEPVVFKVATHAVAGFKRMEYELTPEAIELGLSGALPAIFEVGGQIGDFGQGERARASITQQSLRFLMINRTLKETLPATAPGRAAGRLVVPSLEPSPPAP